MQLARDGQRAVAADHDQRVDAPCRANVAATCSGPSGSSYGLPRRVPSSVPPFGQHAAQRAHVERHRAALEHAVPGVEEADELVAVVQLALADDGPDDRVESRAIAATCQNADAHVCTG